MTNPLTLLRTEILHDGWSKLYRVVYRAPDGSEADREVIHHGDAAAVLPFDPERRTGLLVRLPRAPALLVGGGEMLEAPAGIIEDGELADACIRREAMEEAGVRLDALEPVGVVWSSPGASTERLSLFLAPYAAADRIEQGGGAKGEHENITVVEIGLRELADLADAGGVPDSKTLLLLTTLRLRRPELFQH